MNYRKIFILITCLIILGVIVLLSSNILTFKTESDVYIIFNDDKDVYHPYDWSRHNDIFPQGFNPNIAFSNMEELAKLDVSQKHYYDSIRETDFHYPKKVIRNEMGIRRYFIDISEKTSIELLKGQEKKIGFDDLKELSIISVDSVIQIIPELFYKKKSTMKNEKIEFHILEIYSQSLEVICVDVNPTVIEYN